MPRSLSPVCVAFLIAGCASVPPAGNSTTVPPAATPPPVVELDNAPTGRVAKLQRGGELKIELDANAITGFQWQQPPSPAPTLSMIGQRIYVSKAIDPRNIGAGGTNVFRYRGEQPGTVTLQFEYRRPWETVPPAKVVRYEITVE